MAIFSEPIVLNPVPGVKSGVTERTGKFGKKRFILNSTKEGQDWSVFAPDWRQLDKTMEVYAEHGIEKRGDQELMFVDIGVREKSDPPHVTTDGLEKKSIEDLRTMAPQRGVKESQMMSKPQLIEAIRNAKKPE